MQVFLIDHEHAVAAVLVQLLAEAGLAVQVGVFEQALAARPDSIAIGTQGPLDGRLLQCRQLRDRGYAGVIVTASDRVADGEALLEAGADDFVTTPLEPREFVARLRARLRRSTTHSTLRWGPLELDRVHRELKVHGRSVALTVRESGLLECLMEAGGEVVSRANLREGVWPRKEDRGTNLVEVHLSRLRDKLGADAGLIETVRRAGYKLRR